VIRFLDLAAPDWEPFDPRDGRAGPVEYPDFLTGRVEWLRAFTEGPLETRDGAVGLSICHMEGDATPSFDDGFAEGQSANTETEIMVLLEGRAEARLPDGRTFDVVAPRVVFLPRGVRYAWRYLTAYRAVYVILW
jgi:hypothetical protein